MTNGTVVAFEAWKTLSSLSSSGRLKIHVHAYKRLSLVYVNFRTPHETRDSLFLYTTHRTKALCTKLNDIELALVTTLSANVVFCVIVIALFLSEYDGKLQA